MKPRLHIDRVADAAYVQLQGRAMARTEELDPYRRLDSDAEGAIVGIEFVTVGRGVGVRGLPEGEVVGWLFEDGGIRQLV